MIEFKLPDIGEGIAEGEIVQWLVEEGASVDEHQPVVEVMTDKATVEVPAPAAGVVTKLLAAEGDTVPVGNVIFHLDEGGSGSASVESTSAPANSGEGGGTGGAVSPSAAPQATPAGGGSGGGGEMIKFKLPDIGEGIAEGEIVQWLVEAGAVVEEHQPVVEVMTDKATVEVPAPAAGTIVELLAEAGATVPVGDVIFHLQTGASSGGGSAPAPSAPAASNGSPAPAPSAPAGGGQPARVSHADGKVLAVPSARRVARELGVDLMNVSGSGRGGVVRRADVEAFSKSGGGSTQPAQSAPAAATSGAVSAPPQPISAPPAPAAAAGRASAPAEPIPVMSEEKRTPYRGIRRKIGEAMTRSKHTAAHFTVVEEIDVTELVATRERAKALGKQHGVNVTYMPFIMKAVANGLTRFRSLNGHLDETAGEIILPAEVNIGIATDTPNGLVVPVIRNVERKGMLHLAAELTDLAQRTRDGKVMPDELRGSTFTITNAGNIGGTLATPVINFPDIAILGVHRIVKRPGVIETPEGDEIAIRQYMNLSCSVDHRLADGADAARFLAWMRTLLENPGLLTL
ncbi:Dihydrolipoyllysine-residue acetyltransferase component of pyruvate dehydrogenase complex [Planctomycetes bacterium Poly30]|uniref:Dihydrolipoamide acetyltransferase component of pyruvate dehydrogenase complex n=1 Tax=Saltatorellus ferox TaxID=2528018 RepID=A0A518EPR1_9BACT|nr:Dihydrolipoyllysine-residue acetyltransferase component of pyruvate dehydrogenase complex [Planctomycetes bacterium Poly30]